MCFYIYLKILIFHIKLNELYSLVLNSLDYGHNMPEWIDETFPENDIIVSFNLS